MLVVRGDASLEFGNAQLARDGLGRARVVAGEHDDVDAEFAQFGKRLRRGGLHRIGNGQHSGGAAINRDEDRGRTLGLMRRGKRFQCGNVHNSVLTKKARFANQHAPTRDRSGHATSGRGLEVLWSFNGNLAIAGRDNGSVGQRMFAALFERRGEAEEFGFREPVDRQYLRKLGFPFGQRAGFVHGECIELRELLDGFGVADQHAHLRAAPDADHHAHGRGESERARARDDEHGDGVGDGERKARLWPEEEPSKERERGNRQHRRNEPRRDLVRQCLNRRATALGLPHHLDDARQDGFAADMLGLHHDAASRVLRAAGHPVTRSFLHRQRLTGNHGLVDGSLSFDHQAIHGNLLAGPDAQARSNPHRIERDIELLLALNNSRGLRREIQQRSNGASGLAPRSQLQHLAEQHENGDDRSGLEVDGGLARVAGRRWERLRKQHRDDAEDIGRSDAERDEREHVQTAVQERTPSTHEERPTRPQHDRRAQKELSPPRHVPAHPFGVTPGGNEMRHRHDEHRERERRADPEAARHVAQFGIVLDNFRGDGFRLQRHPTLGASARMVLLDLRVHRAGVDGFGRRLPRWIQFQRHAAFRTRTRLV